MRSRATCHLYNFNFPVIPLLLQEKMSDALYSKVKYTYCISFFMIILMQNSNLHLNFNVTCSFVSFLFFHATGSCRKNSVIEKLNRNADSRCRRPFFVLRNVAQILWYCMLLISSKSRSGFGPLPVFRRVQKIAKSYC